MRTHYCGATKDVAVGETVTICGWVDRRRDHGGVIFLDMRDREGIVQVVLIRTPKSTSIWPIVCAVSCAADYGTHP